MEQIRKQLKSILVQCLDDEIPLNQISRETTLIKELNVHSIVYVEFIVSVEEAFTIELPDENLDINLYNTYGELEDMIVSVICGEKK